MIIDFHTHAFPDALALRAVPLLAKEANIAAALDGRIDSLLHSMDQAGIEQSVVLSIATKPEQFEPILKWSHAIAGPRLIPFPSIHPADTEAARKVERVADEGFKGLKIHPYYQQFKLDDAHMLPFYERVQARGLILLCHTGYDVAFERIPRADPERIRKVTELFPDLKFVTTHLGAWEDWDAARRLLLGRPIYMETSYAISYMSADAARDFLQAHDPDYLVFGTDSPWADQTQALVELRSLNLEPALIERLLHGNAAKLLTGN